jgi:hypothetical protein
METLLPESDCILVSSEISVASFDFSGSCARRLKCRFTTTVHRTVPDGVVVARIGLNPDLAGNFRRLVRLFRNSLESNETSIFWCHSSHGSR